MEKAFVIRVVIDDVTLMKMWSYERFVNSSGDFLGRVFESHFMIPISLFAFKFFCVYVIVEI